MFLSVPSLSPYPSILFQSKRQNWLLVKAEFGAYFVLLITSHLLRPDLMYSLVEFGIEPWKLSNLSAERVAISFKA